VEVHACASRFVPRPELVAAAGTRERSLFDVEEEP
jgi:hypothetical protein